MFTGLIQAIGIIAQAQPRGEGMALTVRCPEIASDLARGESIAVDGCCLTVESLEGNLASFHLMGETLGLTTFGQLEVGSEINLERSLRLGDRLGGHLVSGHIDGLGTVTRIDEGDGQTDITLELGPEIERLTVPKGSICIDGVSLTIAVQGGRQVTVCLIPHTLEITTLGKLVVGDRVQLEMDMIGKWIARLAEPHINPAD